MPISRLLGVAAASFIITMPAMAQAVISEPGYCAQLSPQRQLPEQRPRQSLHRQQLAEHQSGGPTFPPVTGQQAWPESDRGRIATIHPGCACSDGIRVGAAMRAVPDVFVRHCADARDSFVSSSGFHTASTCTSGASPASTGRRTRGGTPPRRTSSAGPAFHSSRLRKARPRPTTTPPMHRRVRLSARPRGSPALPRRAETDLTPYQAPARRPCPCSARPDRIADNRG